MTCSPRPVRRYEVIIIDSPPLLPVTDAALMAAQTDGAILVVRHGKTTKDQVVRTPSSASLGRLHAARSRPEHDPGRPLRALRMSAVDDLDATLHQVRRHLTEGSGTERFTAYHQRLGRVLLKPSGR